VRQQTSLRSGSGLHIELSIPFRRDSPMTKTALFFFMEGVLTQGIGQRNLGDTSKLDEPLSSLLFSSTCGASYPFCKGTSEGGVVAEETCLLRQTGICHHCPLSLKSLCSDRWREDRESSVSCVLSASWPVPGKAGCNSSSITLSHTP